LATGALALSVGGLGVLGGGGVLSGDALLAEVALLAEATWLAVGRFELAAGLWLNGLSWWTALLVASVCLLVTLYAVAYMRSERGLPRFFALMAFFAGAMLTLVLSSSLVLLFMAWEGVGLASFGLIGFWYGQDDSRDAAQKAFLMTRLGDFGLFLGWLLVLLLLGTTSIEALQSAAGGGKIASGTLTLLAMLFFVAAVGKSAQLPLTAWLPDAMAGPTPVSALLHSATMVAAGVYLVLRVFPVFEHAPGALTVVLWMGAATALAAALVATAQHDIKRVLAWSTVSQLGEMMMALGLGGPIAAAFHLTTHAVFKSSLFLCAGALDHEAGSRDLRGLGGLWKAMPLTAGVFGASALALAGFPPFAGFWSEEAILGAAQAHHAGWGVVMLALIFLAGVYIGRAGWAAFGDWPEAPSPDGGRPALAMLAPMLLLGLGALALGYALKAPVEHVLGFSAEPHTLGLWRWAAIAASASGLGLGALRVRAAGPVPALGGWAGRVAGLTDGLARIPARAGLLVAAAAKPLEQGLDALAAALGRGAQGAGGGAQRVEGGLDAGARGTAAATMQSAEAAEEAERKGFGDGLDAAAYALRRIGGQMRRLQTGQLPQYTFSLFVWVLLAGLLVLALWL
jgi:NADH-quinone oxidoreductase subunit L